MATTTESTAKEARAANASADTSTISPAADTAAEERPSTSSGRAPRMHSAIMIGRGLPRRRFVNEMPDRGLFVIIAMFGFGTILAAKLNEFNPDYVAVWAVALMVLYGVVAYRITEVRLRLDRLGDNFYYLGFIFTLGSLAAALIELRAGTPIESLLGSFGIALVTTIVGIAGRVMFVQMRGEIDEIEAQTRRDLLKASQDLREQLALTLRDFQVFQTGMHQASTEILNSSVDAAKSQVSAIVGVAGTAAAAIQESFAASQSQTKGINEAVANIARAVEDLAKRIATMQLPSAELEQQIGSLSQEIETLLRRLRHMMDEFRRQYGQGRRRWFRLFGR